MRKQWLLLAICIVALHYSYGQDTLRPKPMYLHSGKIGLGIDGITGSPNVLMKYFVNNQFAVQVIAGLDLDVPGGSTPPNYAKVIGVIVRGGLSFLFHITQDQVSPYFGLEAVFQYEKQGGFFLIPFDPRNSVAGSGVFGAEFFINERFTLGIKQGLGVNVQLKRDNPLEETKVRFNTSTLLGGRFYFN